MKKIILWGYWAKNFGDDLFLKFFMELVNINNIDIYLLTTKEHSHYYKKLGYKTIISDSMLYRIGNRISLRLRNEELFFCRCNANTIFVMLGGSLFAENKSEKDEERQINNLRAAVARAKDSFVIGSNFGPYRNNEFLKSYQELFEMVKDVCFRDQQSCALFNKDNIRFSQDIAVEYLSTEKIDNQCNHSQVVISPINLTHRQELAKYCRNYEEALVEICNKHIEKGDKITLLSLCKNEGDFEVCINIYKKLKHTENVNIKEYSNIEDILTEIKYCKKVYATRFHAIMVALSYKKKLIPIIYNEKTKNALDSYLDNDYVGYDVSEVILNNVNKMFECNQILQLKTQDTSQFSSLNNCLKREGIN